MIPEKIGFIGAGQMARALAKGVVQANLVTGDQVWASDPVVESRDEFQSLVPGATVVPSNEEVVVTTDVVVLAVKPQQMAEVLPDLAKHVDGNKLVISIAAGVTLARLAEGLGHDMPLVRVMPNTPCLVAQSASAYALGPKATEDHAQLVDLLLSAVGRVFRVEEQQLDAVTGLSGSGPAYVCLLIEALTDGGVDVGLSRELALELAVQTVRGTAELVLETGEAPSVLRQRVTSPGGTMRAGLQVLENRGFRAGIVEAVAAATRRSIELGQA